MHEKAVRDLCTSLCTHVYNETKDIVIETRHEAFRARTSHVFVFRVGVAALANNCRCDTCKLNFMSIKHNMENNTVDSQLA